MKGRNLFCLFAIVLLQVVVASVSGDIFNRQSRDFNPNEVIKDRKVVLDALKCIRGEKCSFPKRYSNLLQNAGPTILVYGYCPPRMCTYEDEQKAKDLLHRISREYPRAFFYTYDVVKKRFNIHT
ncbi:hypothetical protein Avbf_03983 [Armadillidium vulgare]|nr:hypothetical protein Avbf_03983 [Armadillidium vulgare]